MLSRTVTVVNELGMHARAAAKFVHLAARFQSQIRVAHDTREMDGKSIMGILLLAVARGSAMTISAEGADEQAAVEALAALVESGFGEEAPAPEAERGGPSGGDATWGPGSVGE
jgi:phosphocarrier protein